MIDLTEALELAKAKESEWSEEIFLALLAEIRRADTALRVDWDDGAEDWATVASKEGSVRALVRRDLPFAILIGDGTAGLDRLAIAFGLVVIRALTWDEPSFSLSAHVTTELLPDWQWRLQSGAWNLEAFSIADLLWGTV